MSQTSFLYCRAFRACVSLLLAVLLTTLAGCADKQPGKDPLAVRGVFDLDNATLSAGQPVALNGEWEFYWDRLLTPEDFRRHEAAPEPTGYFTLPSTWRGYRLGTQRLGSTGKATFRLRLRIHRAGGRLTLRIFDVHEAYRLWADGILVAQSGVPGQSLETEVPARSVRLADIPLQGQPVELLLQVSNYHFRRGGVTEPLLAALPGPLESAQAKDWAISLCFAGSMLIMGVYHLVLYSWRRRDSAPLYFGLYCLLVVGYSVTSNTSRWAIALLLPGWAPPAMEIFSLTCFVCWASLIFRFLKTIYPDEFHSFPVYFLDARLPIFAFLLIFAPGVPLYWFIALCLLQTVLYAGYYLHRVFLCVRRGRTGARILLAGLSVQFLAGINDPLVHLGLIKSVYLIEPAVFLFILSQSLVLSKRFSRTFDAVERLSVELERKNDSLQAEIEERNRLEKKLVSISEEERRQLSQDLHDSLCQQLTGARLRASALSHEHASDKDGPELAELADMLMHSSREAYKIARGLYPVEYGDVGPSLRKLVRSISQATGIEIAFTMTGRCEQCTSENRIPLYRIAQEALANAAKHAGARTILLDLNCRGDGRMTLTVRDDGVGLTGAETADGGLGMTIMHHRAKIIGATLNIRELHDGGTQVTCTAPCDVAPTLQDGHDAP